MEILSYICVEEDCEPPGKDKEKPPNSKMGWDGDYRYFLSVFLNTLERYGRNRVGTTAISHFLDINVDDNGH